TSGYYYDLSTAQEVQVTIAGGLAEVDRGGPAINLVPKAGGNKFASSFFGSTAGEWSQSSNIDDQLKSYGLSDLPPVLKNWDTSYNLSRPVLRDRLWFFGNLRTVGIYQDQPGLYGNQNAGNANAWDYIKDPNVKVRNSNSKKIGAARLTWQATPKNKVAF